MSLGHDWKNGGRDDAISSHIFLGDGGWGVKLLDIIQIEVMSGWFIIFCKPIEHNPRWWMGNTQMQCKWTHRRRPAFGKGATEMQWDPPYLLLWVLMITLTLKLNHVISQHAWILLQMTNTLPSCVISYSHNQTHYFVSQPFKTTIGPHINHSQISLQMDQSTLQYHQLQETRRPKKKAGYICWSFQTFPWLHIWIIWHLYRAPTFTV